MLQLYYQYGCLHNQFCDKVDLESVMAMLTSIHAVCKICDARAAAWIKYYYYLELEKTIYAKESFAERLEHYLNPKWVEENSFCLDGELSTRPNEVYVRDEGICFILNSKERIYSPRYFFLKLTKFCYKMKIAAFFNT